MLGASNSVTAIQMGSSHYALVASQSGDGLQIIDITDPENPRPAAAVTDSTEANPTDYAELDGAASVAAVRIGDGHYALVGSIEDDGLQIIGITDPQNPFNPLRPNVRLDLSGDRRAVYAGQADGDDKSLVFRYVSKPSDYTADLAYSGAGALSLGSGTLRDADGSDDLSGITLPVPGQPNSLSHARDIALSDAAVTSTTPDGAYGPGQKIDVRVGFTGPVTLDLPVIRDGQSDGAGGTFEELEGAASVTTTTINSRHYALVAAILDDGLQIIDVTDPIRPRAVAAVTDSTAGNPTAYSALEGARSVATARIGTSHYALVASQFDNALQIINITDPASPSPVAAISDGGAYTALFGARSVATVQMGTSHYALVASQFDNALQIINITDPASPSAVAALFDSTTANPSNYTALDGASYVTTTEIGTSHYALVVSFFGDSGLQIIDITDPASPSAVAAVTDGMSDGAGGTYSTLDGAVAVATVQIGTSHYALVAASNDNGLQIIDITDPANPSAVATVTRGDVNLTLEAVPSVATARIGDKHYALVASIIDPGGLQIIDITDPANPGAVAAVTDGTDYAELAGARWVATARIGTSHYALVASYDDDGLQIIDITDPQNPFNPMRPNVKLDLSGDRRAVYAGQADGNKTLAFEYVVQDMDGTDDLAYSGTGALSLGSGSLKADGTGAAFSEIMLPVPGRPNSLSHAKDIVLYGRDAFVTTWRTASANDTITLPISGTGMTVRWGDGGATTGGAQGSASHEYADAGEYRIVVTGNPTRFHLNDGGGASKLVSIDQWGAAKWTSMGDAFRGASNMEYLATDSPDLSGVADTSGMFDGAAKFNGDVSGWNVSSVTDMSGMFDGAAKFNSPIGRWDVSSVTDMSRMFDGAAAFNGDVSGWNVSSVTGMSNMFRGASDFNWPLNSWDVSSVDDMSRMFDGAAKFNSPIGRWDVSSVDDMSRMFDGASAFNSPIGSWNVSSVTDVSYMFRDAGAFDSPIGSWDVSSATAMNGTFSGAAKFNSSLDSWDVSSVADMNHMFENAEAFDSPIGSWNVSSVADMNHMFWGASAFNSTIGNWNVSSVTDMSYMFRNTDAFDQPIGNWNVSSVTDMSGTFWGASAFNSTIASWNVSSVTDMSYMFRSAGAFDQPIGGWDVSSATAMSDMFRSAGAFGQNLGGWYVVLGNTTIARGGVPGIVGTIMAQNDPLNGHSPAYNITAGLDSSMFMIASDNQLNMTSAVAKESYQVNVTSTGDFGTGNHRVLNVTVRGAANQPPELAAIGAKSVDELVELSFTAAATDTDAGDGDALTFSLDPGAPEGASINSTSGAFTWTPSESQDGSYTVTVRVSDGTDSDSEDVTITVNEVNVAPVLAAIGNKTVTAGNSLTFAASATDADIIGGTPDTKAFSLGAGAPANATITAGGSFSWTPTAAQAGSHDVTVTVTDGGDLTDSEQITVTVSAAPNDAPILTAIGGKSVDELVELSFTAAATDTDAGDGDALTFSLDPGAPEGASINSTSGAFTWTPSESQDGSYTVTVRVSDGTDSDSEDVTITVNEVNVAPVLAAIGNKTVTAGNSLTFAASATDADIIGGTPDTKAFSLGAGAPANATITAGGSFSWIPTAAQAGSHDVTVTVTDGGGGATDSEQITVTVRGAANQDPTANAGDDRAVNEGEPVTLDGSGSSDADGTISAHLWTQTAGPTVDLAGADTASPTFDAPPVTADTDFTFSLTVTDNDGAASAADTVTITVRDVPAAANQDPTANAGPDQNVDEGEPVTLDGSGSSDADGTISAHLWTQTAGPTVDLAGADTASPTFDAPPVTADTDFTFSLTVTDNDGAASAADTVIITVNDVPAPTGDAPVARAGPDQTVTARPLSGVTVTLNGSASFDPNSGDALTYLWEQTRGGTVPLNAGGAIATFTPETASDTPLVFKLTVTDDSADQNTGSDSVTIRVPPKTFAANITTADPVTNSRAATFTVEFGRDIDYDTLDGAVSVTGGATVDGIAPPSDFDTYTVTVSGLSEGRQTLSIPAGAVKTLDGDAFAAASRTITVDLTAPVISSARVSGY